MSETMIDCYMSQYACMARIMQNRDMLLSGFTQYYQSVNPDRVYLIGSGTSYNACSAAAEYAENCLGVEVTTAAPSNVGKIYGKRPMAIVVSQGGRSTNTIAMLKKLKSDGIPVVTLTDPKDTPVGNAADFAVLLAAENERVGPKTRGYMATVLTLYLLALSAGNATGVIDSTRYQAELASLQGVINRGDEYLSACQNFYDDNFEDLKTARTVIFTGKGVAAKVAQEDALKVLETLCYPSIGYEYEEFLHGPGCCTDEGLALFIFLSNDHDQERMLKTADIIRQATHNCYIISHNPAVQGEKTLYLPSPSPCYHAPFTDILFGQLISAKLTAALGRTRHPAVKDIFTLMGTKVPVK